MIFKVFFQESIKEVPVREKTQTLYLNAESERHVRTKLAERGYNIEYIEAITGKHLEYEQERPEFDVLEIE
ncbi:DNA-dependent RNA polymerase subunit epsilon [Bacillus massilinigeriensis]|uniref:DNA-dependent RNA polymerase subunit epsilon n=1 Tax=Bacillus mediterraneensis TaxID=1805474 RepID=UPI0008F8069C|nr:DNA-directed RNA polymerase subunit epsilon [Bacillus mediterraneensis]